MTMTSNPDLIQSVVAEVLSRLGSGANVTTASTGGNGSGTGLFEAVDPAVEAARRAQRQLIESGVETRRAICNLIKQMARDNAEAWGRFELDETKVGRLDHKIAKLSIDKVPGVEYLETVAHSGDNGIGLDEAAPWGVIGAITPVTHSIPTLSANAISMIAAGNAMVVNPHPSGAKSAALAAKAYNQAIKRRFGIDPLICVIDPPTLRTAEEIFQHPQIPMLCVTGGPGVARAAMKQPKRAVVAGPGNPPVVIDETADFEKAAKSIIFGAAFDNNLLCIGEKEVFVVDSAFDKMMSAMGRQANALRLNSKQIAALTEAAFEWKKDHHAVKKEYVGKDPAVLAKAAGINALDGIELLYGETNEDSPFVSEEQMMPFVPFVRARDFDHALEMALRAEHGFGHTAIIHSNNLANITRMGRAMNTTLFAVNGPCLSTLGTQGEGYPSYSIATPTGEGVTTPLTFTRFRRTSIADALRMV